MKQKRIVVLAIFLCLCGFSLPLVAQQLSIYAIDTDGGKATLIVTPEKESLLVDAGWPFDSRDADRILAAAKDAGIAKIDYLLVTHYHIDHVGGVPWLLQRIPVGHVIDHGPTVEHDNNAEQLYQAYERAVAKIPHILAKPGDKIPLKGVDIGIVSAEGALLKQVTAGDGENPLCREAGKAPENDENDQSVGFVLRFGKFRMLDLADITAGKERGLFCPANLVGKADVFMVSHHGLSRSNTSLLINSVEPRVAIMNNGALKGGSEEVVKNLYDSPGFEALWQLHSIRGIRQAPEKFVANPEAQCQGYAIEVVVATDGSFTVTNLRNHYSAGYPAK